MGRPVAQKWDGQLLYFVHDSGNQYQYGVRSGYPLAGVEPDQRLKIALDWVDYLLDDPAMWYEVQLQRGQIQYVNNLEIGHYRSEFVDTGEPEEKRFMYRLWHRQTGSRCYDGTTL